MSEMNDQEKAELLFKVWAKQEDIAMHFNELLIRVRTRTLGAGLTLITSAIVLKFGGFDAIRDWLGGVCLLGASFAAIGLIVDALYYAPLLKGAVDALEQLEKSGENKQLFKFISQNKSNPEEKGIFFSNQVETTRINSATNGGHSIYWAYSLMIIVFLALLGNSFYMELESPAALKQAQAALKEARQATHLAVTMQEQTKIMQERYEHGLAVLASTSLKAPTTKQVLEEGEELPEISAVQLSQKQ